MTIINYDELQILTEIVRIKMRSSGIIGGASGAILLGILMIAIGITVFFKRKNCNFDVMCALANK